MYIKLQEELNMGRVKKSFILPKFPYMFYRYRISSNFIKVSFGDLGDIEKRSPPYFTQKFQ